jgi:uncharacterized membrane protein
MRSGRLVLGAMLILAGTVWFFQGIGVLPGSFMSGAREWAVYGALAVIAGAVLLYLNRGKSEK